MSAPRIARVVDVPLSVAEHEDAVADKAAGAVVSFAGVVRDHDGGRSVTELEYVGHPTAQAVIEELAAEFAARPGLTAVADKAAGAVVSFAGVVRDHDGGRSVTELEYVGHPSADDVITEIAAEFAARPGLRAVAVYAR